MCFCCVVCFSLIHCHQRWPRTSKERGSDALTCMWIGWKWRRVALCLTLSVLSWVIWVQQQDKWDSWRYNRLSLLTCTLLAPCWWLAHMELIHPFTGFVFSPAGWHATLLTSILLMKDHSSMWQVVLGYSTCITSSRVQHLGNLDMLPNVKIAYN